VNVEIGDEAALFPEKEYISGIFVAVHQVGCDSGLPIAMAVWRTFLNLLPGSGVAALC
jgi:hypothetical protein